MYSSANRHDKAFKTLETSLKKNKKQPEFWIGIADLYRDTGLSAKADINKIKSGVLAALDKAEVLKPENPSKHETQKLMFYNFEFQFV